MLQTARLTLRPFTPADLAPFAAINADPQVMRFFPAPYTRAQTAGMLEAFAEKWRSNGLAFAAVEDRSSGELLGMCGLNTPPETLPISPCTEVGWRLTPSAWGKGLATEAAEAWLTWGFARGIPEILAFAPSLNAPSLAVMRRLNMTAAPDLAFDHPAIPKGHPLRPMKVHRLAAPG